MDFQQIHFKRKLSVNDIGQSTRPRRRRYSVLWGIPSIRPEGVITT
jgi:hypothetical protein